MDPVQIDDLIPDNKLAPRKGRILIAEPFMDDPYFKRTVVLLCEHNQEGSFGFVLNRYIESELSDLLDSFPPIGGFRVSVGGPVQNNSLFYLHTMADIPNSENIFGQVYMGGDLDIIKSRLEEGLCDHNDIRFFVGYAGWSDNQLFTEIKAGSWYVSKPNSHFVMDTSNDGLWNYALERMGGKFTIVSHFPEDPTLN